MRTKILVIDDEEAVCEILKYNLEKEGYEVDTAYSAEEALDKDLYIYQLFMVDIMMDGLDGFEFAKRIRNVTATENIPILFCTALTDEDNIVKGLNLGGDDYVTKPFVLGEVLARVRAVLRRTMQQKHRSLAEMEGLADLEGDIVFNGIRIDRNDRMVYIDATPATLTPTEYDLLLFFLTHRNRIYTRKEIVKRVWGRNDDVSFRAIDTNITRLRKKLGEYEKNIVTRQGFGYGFKETN